MKCSAPCRRAALLPLVGVLGCNPAGVSPDGGTRVDAEPRDAAGPDAFVLPERRRCDGQRLEGLYEGQWVDLGGCAVEGPNECGPGLGELGLLQWNETLGPSTACLPVQPLESVAATSANDVWVANDTISGTWHWDGREWNSRPGPRTTNHTTITIADPGRPWLHDQLGHRLFHYDGEAWQPVRLDPPDRVVGSAVADVGGGLWLEVYATGCNRLLHFDGVGWAEEEPAGPGSPIALARGAGAIWIARRTDEGLVLDRWAGARFESASGPLTPRPSSHLPQLLPLAPDDVWVVIADGVTNELDLHHWDGTSWTRRSLPRTYFAVSLARHAGQVLALGAWPPCGTSRGSTDVHRWDGTEWIEVTDGIAAALPAQHALRAFAVGEEVWALPWVFYAC